MAMDLSPTKEAALQFALMIASGMPPVDAIGYFYKDLGPLELKDLLKQWLASSTVQNATLALQGSPWQEMTLDERVEFAVNKTYAEMAYYLYSRNYSTLEGSALSKADKCREALERKIAGTAGKSNPLFDWWEDVRKGKVKLGSSASPALN